ncbi:MAG: PspA/IM30 family protein [Spirochaetales bacterium]|nr:PspA/IM30 family protein [Spirochaetales bacterium]
MGIFKRLSDVFKANINDLISKAENPEKMLNQMIIDMNEHLIEAKKGVASSIADEKRLERQLLENKNKSKEWESKAMLAVKAGKDDLAKQALVRKQEYEGYVVQLQPQWEAQHAACAKLKESLKALQDKIEEAQRKKNILIARAKRAETTKKINQTMGNIGNNDAFAVFDRMSEKVEKIEAEADAMVELSDLSTEGSLESEFKKLESGQGKGADLLLEELKAKMNEGEGGN